MTRAPQQERSRATRLRLLEAAVECLAERGWSGSTVTTVAELAGVSRGAAQHHFPTRESLFIAAVDHVATVRGDELRAQVAARRAERGGNRLSTHEIVQLVVGIYTGTLFRAALELWVASSDQPPLREQVLPLEARMGRDIHRAAVELLDVDELVPGVRELIQATLDLGRGLGLANLLTDDSRRRAPIVAQWARTLDAALAGARRPARARG